MREEERGNRPHPDDGDRDAGPSCGHGPPGGNDALSHRRELPAALEAPEDGEEEEGGSGENDGLDHREGDLPIDLACEDLRGEHAEAAAEDVRRREGGHRGHEDERCGGPERGREHRERDAEEDPAPAGSEGLGGLGGRGV